MTGLSRIVSRAHVALAAASLSLVAADSASAITLDDITDWTGTGDSEAGLVIDWADGSDPAVFGYRFDGPATGQDMFEAIFADNPGLYAKVVRFGFGDSAVGIGYDRDGDGFAISDGGDTTTSDAFTDGILITTTDNADGNTPTDADDSYLEGWNTGFWGYYVSDGTADWGFASTGFGGRALADGVWDGFAYQPGFAGSAPAVDVPEPASAAVLGLLACSLVRRRNNSFC